MFDRSWARSLEQSFRVALTLVVVGFGLFFALGFWIGHIAGGGSQRAAGKAEAEFARDWEGDLNKCPVAPVPGLGRPWVVTPQVKVEVLGFFPGGEGKRVLVKLTDRDGPFQLTGHAMLHYRHLTLAGGEGFTYLARVESLDLNYSEQAKWPRR